MSPKNRWDDSNYVSIADQDIVNFEKTVPHSRNRGLTTTVKKDRFSEFNMNDLSQRDSIIETESKCSIRITKDPTPRQLKNATFKKKVPKLIE